ncbi:DUF2797 domain-containing protein [Candidatus Thorarchaeota archaeon]|nr:MAG: DUF2797 domain-containing protein [Candidatus Thorarchaeota archaeon]
MQVADVTWRMVDEKRFESGLRIWREGEQTPSFLPLSPRKKISWEIRGPKRCIGSINEAGKLIPCPENSVILDSGQKCGPCSAGDIADPCIRCDGRRCDAVDARRQQCEATDYVVYAVVFNDKTLKVGVSSKGRALTRWVEQGADFAGVLREISGGRTARRIEDRIGRQQGVTKQVRSERKTRALMEKLEQHEAQSLVHDFAERASHLELNPDVDLQDLSQFYSLEELRTQPAIWRKRSQPIEGRTIIGTVEGMKGSLMVTSIDTSLLVVDLKQIVGYSINQDSDITMMTQTGLMDFL